MATSYEKKSPKDTFNDILSVDNSNNGIATSLKDIISGSGTKSCMQISDDGILLKPNNDNGEIIKIQTLSGATIFKIETSVTHPTILIGSTQLAANTLFKDFGIKDASPVAGTHHAMSCMTGSHQQLSEDFTPLSFGSGTNPATSYTFSTNSDDVVSSMWIMSNGIILDEVRIIAGADGSATVNFHLMSFDFSTSGADAGDLSNGDVNASSGGEGSLSPITIGADRVVTSTLTLDEANINPNKAILAFVENVGGTDDLTCSMQIQYHIR